MQCYSNLFPYALEVKWFSWFKMLSSLVIWYMSDRSGVWVIDLVRRCLIWYTSDWLIYGLHVSEYSAVTAMMMSLQKYTTWVKVTANWVLEYISYVSQIEQKKLTGNVYDLPEQWWWLTINEKQSSTQGRVLKKSDSIPLPLDYEKLRLQESHIKSPLCIGIHGGKKPQPSNANSDKNQTC